MSEFPKACCKQIMWRILTLIPHNPQILGFETASDLRTVPGFDVSDLDPSGLQVSMALAEVKAFCEKIGTVARLRWLPPDEFDVPFSFFEPAGDGTSPDFSKLSFADWGQCVFNREYPADCT